MLSVDLKKIEKIDTGYKITGVWDEKEGSCTTKKIIAHPSYMKLLGMNDKLKETSVTRRSICILNHPIEGLEKCKAVQIILPQN